MKPIPPNQQQASSSGSCRLAAALTARRRAANTSSRGRSGRPPIRARRCFTRPPAQPIGFEDVIREYAKIGIGHWCTHDTDVIPTEQLGKDGQKEIVGPNPEEPEEARPEVLHGDHRNVLSRGLGRESRRGVAGGARVCGIPRVQHGGDRPRTGRAVCRLLARLARLLHPGRGGRDPDACAGTPMR